jgi:hypothetical protein
MTGLACIIARGGLKGTTGLMRWVHDAPPASHHQS